MQEIINEYAKLYNVQGISFSIYDQGKEVFYGEVDSTKHTRYTIGSVSKLFVATAIMQLCEKGLCHLDDYVSKYIPTFYKDIKVKQLLNHSCGLSSCSFNGKYSNHYYPDYVDHMVEMYSHAPIKSTPGKYSVYCNDGFVIAQRIIEIISGGTFLDYLKKNIFEPLHMDDTTCPPTVMEEGTYKKALTDFDTLYPQEFVNGIGSGGIYSTASDLGKFMHSFGTYEILTKDSCDTIMASHNCSHINIEYNSGNYGLGLDHIEIPFFKAMGYKAVCKGGATYGYLSYVVYLPEIDLAFSVVSSSKSGNVAKLVKDIAYHYMQKEVIPYELSSIESSIEEGIYGNYMATYKIEKIDQQYIFSMLEDDHFTQKCILEKEDQYLKADKVLNFNNALLSFYHQDGEVYLVVDYDDLCSVRNRMIIGQKVLNTGHLTLDKGYYVRKNEYHDQRNMNTQGQLSMYIDEHMLTPYPLKVVSDTKAIPYIEIPGSYSREMCAIEVIDSTHFKSGYYIYEKLNDRKLQSITLKEDVIEWFKYNQETYQVSKDVRIIGVDSKGKYTYDSYLSSDKFVGDYIGFVGVEGSEVQVF